MNRRHFLLLSGAAALAGCGSDPPAAQTGDVPAGDVPSGDALDATTDGFIEERAPLDDLPPLDDMPAADAPRDASVEASADGGASPSLLPEELTAFPLGVMSGEMTADTAVLWTRFAATAPLSLRVYEGGADRVVLERAVTPADGGFVHATVTGLTPATLYRFAFVRRDGARDVARSTVGRFRTAPADDATPVVTFAGTSCTHQRGRPFPTMRHAAGRELEFFVHAGDLTYCDGARSLADFREKYAENLTSEGLRALFASTGLFATWDDHEVDNNFNPETTPAATLANARAAYFEHHPQLRNPAAPDRLWRSFRWGRTLELFILDCRAERLPSSRLRPDGQYISRAQMDWLKAGLSASRAVFKLIVNSVPIANFPLLFDFGASDRWEGYAAQRVEILSHITRNAIEDVWWLSGDFHLGCVGRVESSGEYSRMREVLMGPGGNTGNPLYTSLLGDQWEFKTPESNYTVFRCDPAARAMTVSVVNGEGRELFSRRYA